MAVTFGSITLGRLPKPGPAARFLLPAMVLCQVAVPASEAEVHFLREVQQGFNPVKTNKNAIG